jgi:5-methylcytosine-specific restriction endonuclease McrA
VGEVYIQLPLVVPMKRCSKCKRDLPHSAFGRYARRADGLQNYCKDCMSAYSAKYGPQYYLNHREEAREYRREYYAEHRESLKAGVLEKQKAPHRVAYRTQWARNNPEKSAAFRRSWRERNPELSREYVRRRYVWRKTGVIAPFTLAQLQDKMRYWGGRCWMCGEPATTVDHVKPISKGGRDILANMRPACAACNSKKHAKWPYPLVRNIPKWDE